MRCSYLAGDSRSDGVRTAGQDNPGGDEPSADKEEEGRPAGQGPAQASATARIPAKAPPAARAPVPYGLTARELAVLRLLAAGRSNAQIGTELYISASTAGVHVSSILRKLGVSSRVQAAAVAERAGLLRPGQP